MSTPKRAPLYLIRALAVRGAVLTGDIHCCLTGLLGLDDGGLGGPGGDEVELEALEDDLKFLAGDELDVHPLDIVGGEQVGTRRSPGIDLEAEGTQIAEIHLLTGFQTSSMHSVVAMSTAETSAWCTVHLLAIRVDSSFRLSSPLVCALA